MDEPEENVSAKSCVFMPHTRKSAHPFLSWGIHLYLPTNVKSKSGTKYYRCSDYGRGCPATAHTKINIVDEEEHETYLLEHASGMPHSCGRTALDMLGVKFALKVYEKCVTFGEKGHKSLHYSILNAFRKDLNSEVEKNKFASCFSCFSKLNL